MSSTGETIDSLLDREKLFAGQAPESFRFGPYYRLHEGLSLEQLSAVRGSSEIAFRAGCRVAMTTGDEHNYKITTMHDLDKFKQEINEREEEKNRS